MVKNRERFLKLIHWIWIGRNKMSYATRTAEAQWVLVRCEDTASKQESELKAEFKLFFLGSHELYVKCTLTIVSSDLQYLENLKLLTLPRTTERNCSTFPTKSS